MIGGGVGGSGGGGGGDIGLDAESLKDLKFMMNSSKKETDIIKKLFSPQKLALLNDLESKIKMFEYDIDILKAAADASAKNTDINEIKNKLMEYTTHREFKKLAKDYSGFVKREEYYTLISQLEFMEKNLG